MSALHIDPRIGVLVRQGVPIYYAYCEIGTYHELPTLEAMQATLARLDAGDCPLWVMADNSASGLRWQAANPAREARLGNPIVKAATQEGGAA